MRLKGSRFSKNYSVEISGSSTKIVVLSSIRNEAQRMRIESLCDWMNEKQVIDTDGKKLIFKVENT